MSERWTEVDIVDSVDPVDMMDGARNTVRNVPSVHNVHSVHRVHNQPAPNTFSTTKSANGIAHVNPGETALSTCKERASFSITKSISSA